MDLKSEQKSAGNDAGRTLHNGNPPAALREKEYEGGVSNYNYNYAGPAGMGGSEKLKSGIDDAGAQGREKRMPTTMLWGKMKI